MASKTSHKKEPLFHVVKRTDLAWWKALLIRLAAIVFGIVLACLVLFISVGANPLIVIRELFNGCFGTPRRIWILFRDFALLLIVGLALIPAFKMKFWNLGGNGQITVGALASIMCMFFMGNAGLPDWLIIIAMVFSSILAGVIWAVIPAIFKAHFNTNESLFTLMMNYVAVGLVTVFINSVVKSGSGTLNPLSSGNLPNIVNNYLLTIIVAAILFAFIFFYLKFSKHGYELEVVGESQNTAKYVGINVKKVIIRTMVLSGALCGIVGLLLAGSINHTINADSANNMGFTAIMTSWLAQFNPVAMVGTTFLVSFLNNGMSSVQSTFGITNSSIANIVVGLVYFSIIAVEFFVSYKVVRTHKSVNDKHLLKALTKGLTEMEVR